MLFKVIYSFSCTDTEHWYSVAFDNVAQKYGKRFTFELKKKVTGVGPKVYPKMIVDELQLPITPEEFFEQCEDEYPKLFAGCSIMPGVERLLDHLHKHKIPCAIASSSKKLSYGQKTSKFGPKFQNYWHHIILGPDEPEVKLSKPAPDTYLVCKSRFNPSPDSSKCLVFEDSMAGVVSGCRAGMQVVWIPDPRLDVIECMDKDPELKPTQILKSMEDFKPEDFGLPPYVPSN